MGQPDLGQTVIFAATWFVLVLVAGLSMRIMGMLAGTGVAGLILASFFYPVAQQRINIWLFDKGDSFQVDQEHAMLPAGGLLGTGHGAGLAKFQLPQAHTDYLFPVLAQTLGLNTPKHEAA